MSPVCSLPMPEEDRWKETNDWHKIFSETRITEQTAISENNGVYIPKTTVALSLRWIAYLTPLFLDKRTPMCLLEQPDPSPSPRGQISLNQSWLSHAPWWVIGLGRPDAQFWSRDISRGFPAVFWHYWCTGRDLLALPFDTLPFHLFPSQSKDTAAMMSL